MKFLESSITIRLQFHICLFLQGTTTGKIEKSKGSFLDSSTNVTRLKLVTINNSRIFVANGVASGWKSAEFRGSAYNKSNKCWARPRPRIFPNHYKSDKYGALRSHPVSLRITINCTHVSLPLARIARKLLTKNSGRLSRR